MRMAPSCTPFNSLCQGTCRFFGDLAAAFLSGLNPATPSSDELSPEEIERIRQSLLRIRRDIQSLPADFLDQLVALFQSAFGGPEGLRDTVFAWANLVDTLIHEAERHYGAHSGQGAIKKRRVKGALLYLVRRSEIKIAHIPGFVAPILWSVLLDFVIETFVRFYNRNRLWSVVPQSAPMRVRVFARVERAAGVFEWLARAVTNLTWRFLFLITPVSSRMKQSVDDFVRADPDPFRSALVLLSWTAEHASEIATLGDLISVALVETQQFLEANDQQRVVFARTLILAFLESEVGLPEEGGLAYRLLVAAIDAGIELFTMLSAKHARTTRAPIPVPAA